MDPTLSVRLADPSDIPQITTIVNHYIVNSVATFRTEILSESTILDTYNSVCKQGLPYFVATAAADSESPSVLGYAYASGYRMPTHKAYCRTAEITIFVHPAHLGRGAGSTLLSELLSRLRHSSSSSMASESQPTAEISEVLCIMAVDTDGPHDGLGLRDWYLRWGFEEVGRLKRVGFKFGKWIDTLILQLSLKAE